MRGVDGRNRMDLLICDMKEVFDFYLSRKNNYYSSRYNGYAFCCDWLSVVREGGREIGREGGREGGREEGRGGRGGEEGGREGDRRKQQQQYDSDFLPPTTMR